jgi:hypothetical protein
MATVQRSAAILVANATATTFRFDGSPSTANLAVVFYTSAGAATGDEVAVGSGSRDLTITATVGDPVSSVKLSFAFDGGTVTALAGRTFKTFSAGVPMDSITVAAAANSTPGGALAYRIWVVS